MQELKQRILSDGRVIGQNILKVDNFLNHQIDVSLLNRIGVEFKNIFSGEDITRILTVEASGISVACLTALHFNVPVVFAKKSSSKNLNDDTYESEVYSYTRGISYRMRVSKRYINHGDRVLIIDDFLANGNAVLGLKKIIDEAGSVLVGAGIVIEKGFQDGGRLLRAQGIRVESLAVIESMKEGEIFFA